LTVVSNKWRIIVTVSSETLFTAAVSCFCVAALAARGADGVPAERTNSTLELTVTVAKLTNTNCILEVSVRNTCPQPLLVFQNDLPWMSRHSLLILLVESGSQNRLIEEQLFIDDPKAGQVGIKPGEILKGRIDLARRFPKLPGVLETKDVFLFWSYQLKPVDEQPEQRIGGFLLLPSKENRRKP
jgi:hypothetical protein